MPRSMVRPARLIPVTLLVAFLAALPASAQITTGTILGTVHDAQGAVIPNVGITARHLGTGVSRTATTSDLGDYRIASMPVGSYEVTASVAGFRTEVRSGIELTVGADLTLNFALAVGVVSEKVEVNGQAPLVDTADSTMSQLVDERTVRELPLNGRDWLQLATLQAGVAAITTERVAGQSRVQVGNGTAITISGARTSENNYRWNGITINDYANNSPGSGLGYNMGVDSVQEFSVLTNTPPAEYGRTSGGVVNAVMKSGTNQIHGTGFEFIRNSDVDSRNFYDLVSAPPFRRNQFGGSVGGPIKKQKTFFFANYEGLRQYLSQSLNAVVPSPNARAGNLTAGKVAVNPLMVPYINMYPMPNTNINGDTGHYQAPAPQVSSEDFVTGKVDHYFSSKDSANVSYLFDKASQTSPDNLGIKIVPTYSTRQVVTLSETHLFSGTLVNNYRQGFNRVYAANNVTGVVLNQALVDPTLSFVPNEGVGRIQVSGLDNMNGAPTTGGVSIFNFNDFQEYDDLSWTKGRHALKFGGGVERIQNNFISPDQPTGQWTFPSIATFITGAPNQFQADITPSPEYGERQTVLSFYAQDDFHVRRNFTVNLGLRYEFATVLSNVNNNLANLRNLYDAAPTIGNPYYMNQTKKDFEPRVGFAWDVFGDGKTAVRAAAGMFDILPLAYLYVNKMPRSLPFWEQGSLALNSNSPIPGIMRPDYAFSLLGSTTLATQDVQFNPKRSYRTQWNLNVQHEFTGGLTVTLGYVGAHAVHLPRQIIDLDINNNPQVSSTGAISFLPNAVPLNPHFGRITGVLDDVCSSYEAMQLTVLKRMSHGVQFQGNYTWSKSMDDTSDTFSDSETSVSIGDPYPFWASINRGRSDFDQTHRLVLNFQWDIPTPAAWNGLAKGIVGGWQLGGIFTAQSGSPFSLLLGFDNQGVLGGLGSSTNLGERPNFVPGPGCENSTNPGQPNKYVNVSCFALPAKYTMGNLGRNALIGPGVENFDLSLFKNHRIPRISESFNAQLRFEFFNVLNHPNFEPTRWVIFNAGGVIPSSVGQFTATSTTSRQLQAGLKLTF
jgi:hypothetical protein